MDTWHVETIALHEKCPFRICQCSRGREVRLRPNAQICMIIAIRLSYLELNRRGFYGYNRVCNVLHVCRMSDTNENVLQLQ